MRQNGNGKNDMEQFRQIKGKPSDTDYDMMLKKNLKVLKIMSECVTL